jgi:BMFP domain-containing protein YqiC
MQSNNRLLDDIAKVANGALSAAAGARQEVEQLMQQRLERFLNDQGWVTREEFEAVRDMARKAREAQEDLANRLAELEARMPNPEAASKAKAKAKAKRTPKPRTKAAPKPRAKSGQTSRPDKSSREDSYLGAADQTRARQRKFTRPRGFGLTDSMSLRSCPYLVRLGNHATIPMRASICSSGLVTHRGPNRKVARCP